MCEQVTINYMIQKTMIDEEATRLERLKMLQDAKINPYPAKSERTHTCAQIFDNFEKLDKDNKPVTICGRIRSIRKHGGLTFINLEDQSAKIQTVFTKDNLGTDDYKFLKDTLDLGDFIEVQGTPFVTKTDEKSIEAKSYRILTKSLLPLPEKFHGLTDTEIRYRKRYLDLLANESVRNTFVVRSKIIEAIRNFFNEKGFLEVETPILQQLAGGATAKPFKTHHNALDMDMFLRVAPELFLKKLLVGGYEQVYEIAKCFRNEGIDHNHNPEFTQIEFYWAYKDYNDLMDLIEELFPFLLKEIGLGLKFETLGEEVDFTPPYPRKTMRELIIEYAKIDIEDYPDAESLYKKAKELNVEDITTKDGRGKLIDEIYKTFARPNIINPIFMIDHPVELSPLSKRKEDDPRYVERMQLVCVGGNELTNGFSELNDPIDQEERFRDQEKLKKSGDEEAQPYDKDFVEALKHGMPPAAGLGMGIDRLVKLLTNSPNLKEVILFPTLRKKDE